MKTEPHKSEQTHTCVYLIIHDSILRNICHVCVTNIYKSEKTLKNLRCCLSRPRKRGATTPFHRQFRRANWNADVEPALHTSLSLSDCVFNAIRRGTDGLKKLGKKGGSF